VLDYLVTWLNLTMPYKSVRDKSQDYWDCKLNVDFGETLFCVAGTHTFSGF